MVLWVCSKTYDIHRSLHSFSFCFTGVDQEFEKLMNTIFGLEIMEEFKMKRPAGYVDLMIAFEARKRTASPFKNNPLNISLPFSFIDFYKKKKVKTIRSSFFFSHLCMFELNFIFISLLISLSSTSAH